MQPRLAPQRTWYGWAIALAVCALLFALRGVLTPVLVAFGLAYVLDPLVDRAEAVGLPRVAGILLLLLFASLGVLLFGLLLLPAIARDLGALASELPAGVSKLIASVEPWLAAHGLPLPHSGSEALAAFADRTKDLVPDAVGLAEGTGAALLGGTVSVVGAVVAAVMVPVLAFHLLRDFDIIVAAVVELLPRSRRDAWVATGREIHAVLGQFLRGQLTVMSILAVLYATGYTLVGVRLAIPIGLIAGFFSFIPYVGGALALGLGVLMTVLHFSGYPQLLGVLAVYAAVQAAEGFVITPRIVGEKLGLPAVTVLLALMAGGELFGFLGVMLALPAAAVTKVLVAQALARYRASALYAGTSAITSAPPARLRLRRPRRGRTRSAS